jgi:ribosomal protein S30
MICFSSRAKKDVKATPSSGKKRDTSNTNSPQTPKIQAKRDSGKKKDASNTNSPQTPKVQSKLDSPVTPSSGERRFFKHRVPGSAEKFIPGVVTRKGFDIKFTPNRKDISLGKHTKVSEKVQGNKKGPLPLTPFPKGKIQNIRRSGFLVKKNVRHSYPSGSKQKFSVQRPGSAQLQGEQVVKVESNESSSPNSVTSEMSIHSGPSIRVKSGSQSTELFPSLVSASDIDTNSSVTSDVVSQVTEETSSAGDTSSETMEGIRPLEASPDDSPKEGGDRNDDVDAPQRDSESDKSAASPEQKYFPIFNKGTPSPKSRLRSLRDTKTRYVTCNLMVFMQENLSVK